MIDYDKLTYTKYGFWDSSKFTGRYSASDKPESFNGLRHKYREMYLIKPKEEADKKILELSQLQEQWIAQLEAQVDNTGEAELIDPDALQDMPNLGDLIKLQESILDDICRPIRNELERRRLTKKINYWQSKIAETQQAIDALVD